jgi:hypothetical protein
VEEIIRELVRTRDTDFHHFLEERRRWCAELFAGLSGV